MKVKAVVSLNIKNGNYAVYAGLGYQKDADIPLGKTIGDALVSGSDHFLEVETTKHGIVKVRHGDYTDCEDE